VIGLLVTGVLGVAGVVLLLVAGGLALGRAGSFDVGPGPDAVRASATVLDVDSYGDADFGYEYSVDVQYPTAGGLEVASVDWPDDEPPQVGDVVDIAYDPADPEWAEVVPGPDEPAGAETRPATDGTDPATVAAWGVGFLALTLVALVATVLWARRAPRPEPPAPYGPYGHPPPYGYAPAPGYPQPYGYPPAAGYPPAYGYPAAPSHQPPPPPPVPTAPPQQPTAAPPRSPAPPPTAPPAGGWPRPR